MGFNVCLHVMEAWAEQGVFTGKAELYNQEEPEASGMLSGGTRLIISEVKLNKYVCDETTNSSNGTMFSHSNSKNCNGLNVVPINFYTVRSSTSQTLWSRPAMKCFCTVLINNLLVIAFPAAYVEALLLYRG